MRVTQRLDVWLPALAAMLSVATVQCGDDLSTGRARVAFDVWAQGVNPVADTSLGWRVRIEQAAVAVGPLRWFEGAPLFGVRSILRALSGTAWAHPGHYVPGGAMADVTQRAVVDLTGARAFVGRAEGVSGAVLSAHVELRPDGGDLGPARALLRGGTLSLRGTATRGDRTVRFEASPTLNVSVEGVPARAENNGSPGAWVLSVDLARWVDRADFSTLPMTDGYAPFGDDSQPASALYRGATTGAAYRFDWSPSAADAGR